MIPALEGCHVLVADDEPLIAMDLAEELQAAGAVIVGPSNTLESAIELVSRERVEAAVLDIKLGEELIYPLADMLAAKKIPFVFLTGCAESIPTKYANVQICNKPVPSNSVVAALKECSIWKESARSDGRVSITNPTALLTVSTTAAGGPR